MSFTSIHARFVKDTFLSCHNLNALSFVSLSVSLRPVAFFFPLAVLGAAHWTPNKCFIQHSNEGSSHSN